MGLLPRTKPVLYITDVDTPMVNRRKQYTAKEAAQARLSVHTKVMTIDTKMTRRRPYLQQLQQQYQGM